MERESGRVLSSVLKYFIIGRVVRIGTKLPLKSERVHDIHI